MKSVKLLSIIACAIFAQAATAQTELKFGHVGAPGSLFAKSSEEFAKRANAKLGSKYKVVVFGSSQLGGDKELLQKLKLGTVDFALPSSVMSSEVDMFGIFEMPYLVKDRKHMGAIEKAVFWPNLAPEAEKKGLKILAVWENGYRHITNSKRPINVPADLQGIKLRTPKGKWRVKAWCGALFNQAALIRSLRPNRIPALWGPRKALPPL
jgi:TRAP-type C4-dicarboxylate transport system substrate-binding protein